MPHAHGNGAFNELFLQLQPMQPRKECQQPAPAHLAGAVHGAGGGGLNLLHHIHAINHLAKHAVAAIQPEAGEQGNRVRDCHHGSG